MAARGTKLTGWRKIARAWWRPPEDPQVYGIMEFDASPMLAYAGLAREHGHHVTPTDFVGRAVAVALREVPDFNVRIVGGRVVPRDTVDIFFITAVDGGRELSGIKIERTDEKSVLEVSEELRRRATEMKTGDDPEFARAKRMISSMPRWLLRPSMRLSAWLAADHDRDIPLLGLSRSPWGSGMISSIGMFGIPQGFSPLTRFYRVPVLVLLGEIVDKAWVVDGAVEVRPVISITATIDHRYADAWHISRLVKPFKAYMEDPARFEPALPRLPAGDRDRTLAV